MTKNDYECNQPIVWSMQYSNFFVQKAFHIYDPHLEWKHSSKLKKKQFHALLRFQPVDTIKLQLLNYTTVDWTS